ncbi:MAG: hypothetical protein RIC15_05770 [Vicingaceae bacterium]
MQVLHGPVLIEKENIANLDFPKSDVLENPKEKKERLRDLKNANELGDLAQYKVKILFKDSHGMKKVETTVWNATADNVVLKYGITIPVRRVSKVVFP